MAAEIDTGTETVRSRIEAGVGIIELNRPERRNALHPDMYDALPRLIKLFEADESVGCILLTGAGTAFCAGGDVRLGVDRSSLSSSRVPPEDDLSLAHHARCVLMLHHSPKLTMAALPGPAVGAGIGLALATDLRIAAESARLVTGWARLAFSGDFGGTWFLTRLLGPSRALAALVDNATISANAALALGLFNRVVPDQDLMPEAIEWAASIAAGPRTAQAYMKQNVRDAMDLPLAAALPLESERQMLMRHTKDHREAVRRWLAESEARRPGGR